MVHPLTDVQTALAAQSRDTWSRVEAAVRDGSAGGLEHIAGARLVFHGIDPTSQRAHPVGRAIVVKIPDERFIIPLEDELTRRVSQLREAQTLFGWSIGREPTWYAIGEIVQTHQFNGPGPGEPATPNEPRREHDLALREIYIPDQIMIDADGVIPGLDAAMQSLDELQKGVHAPVTASPDVLVAYLPQVLATHHWRAFTALCDDALAGADKRMAFEQFCQAWEVSGGSLALDSMEGDPAATEEGGVVRTRIKRAGSKGEELVRPLRWIKRGATWRYAGGIL